MSSTEFDLSVPPSSEQIRKREFATVRRGYDADQVRDYLAHIADQIEKLELQVHDAQADAAASSTAAGDATAALQAALDRARVAERDAKEARETHVAAVESVDPYSAFGEKMAEMLRSAETDAAEIRAEADSVRTRAEMEARAEADRITTDAQARAEELRTESELTLGRAREEADRLLAGLRFKKESLRADLGHMREQLLAMADSLEAFADEPGAPEASDIGGETKFFSEEQLRELWSEGDESADPAGNEPLSQASGLTKFFSEEQLTELWAAEQESDALFTDMVDATMADVVESPPQDVTSEAVPTPEPAPTAPVTTAESPFFVDETTRPDEGSGTGLYPR